MALAAVTHRRRPQTAGPDSLEALLREIVIGQQRIIALLEQRRRPNADPVSDATLLATIAASNPNGACFSAAELIAHAAVDAGLRHVLSGGLMHARRLGNKLRTLAGLDLGGFTLQRVARDETGCIWQLHTVARPANDDGA